MLIWLMSTRHREGDKIKLRKGTGKATPPKNVYKIYNITKQKSKFTTFRDMKICHSNFTYKWLTNIY